MLYRLRQKAHRQYFGWRTRRIDSTPPLPTNPEGRCTVHTMLSARDVSLYIPAIKSLIRFCPGVAVTVHSDGTLTREHYETVARHVLGVRFVEANEADVLARRSLGADSYLYRWRSHDASWRRVIDTELWCKSPKRLIIDPDVVVTRTPEELLDWIEGGSGPFLFGQPPTPGVDIDGDPLFIQTQFRTRIAQIGSRLGMPSVFPQGSTSGFYGCESELALDRVEHVLKGCEAEGLPMAQWGSEQCTVIYLLESAGAKHLAANHYLNYDPTCDPLIPDARAVHFYGTYRYHGRLYPKLAAKVAKELQPSL